VWWVESGALGSAIDGLHGAQIRRRLSWAWLMAMVDLDSAWVPGRAVGSPTNRALASADAGSGSERPTKNWTGSRSTSAQDAVCTSCAWLRRLLIDGGARFSYSENGARGNPWIESLRVRFKRENASLIPEPDSSAEFRKVVERQMRCYNRQHRPSGVGNRPPLDCLESVGFNPCRRCTN